MVTSVATLKGLDRPFGATAPLTLHNRFQL